jgi:hypothetical protein
LTRVFNLTQAVSLSELDLSEAAPPSLTWIAADRNRCDGNRDCVLTDFPTMPDQIELNADTQELEITSLNNHTKSTWKFALRPKPRLLVSHQTSSADDLNCEGNGCNEDLMTDYRVHYTNVAEKEDEFCSLSVDPNRSTESNGAFWIPVTAADAQIEKPDAWRTVLPADRTELSMVPLVKERNSAPSETSEDLSPPPGILWPHKARSREGARMWISAPAPDTLLIEAHDPALSTSATSWLDRSHVELWVWDGPHPPETSCLTMPWLAANKIDTNLERRSAIAAVPPTQWIIDLDGRLTQAWPHAPAAGLRPTVETAQIDAQTVRFQIRLQAKTDPAFQRRIVVAWSLTKDGRQEGLLSTAYVRHADPRRWPLFGEPDSLSGRSIVH